MTDSSEWDVGQDYLYIMYNIHYFEKSHSSQWLFLIGSFIVCSVLISDNRLLLNFELLFWIIYFNRVFIHDGIVATFTPLTLDMKNIKDLPK